MKKDEKTPDIVQRYKLKKAIEESNFAIKYEIRKRKPAGVKLHITEEKDNEKSA